MPQLVGLLRLEGVMATEALGACPRNVLGVCGWFIESYGETAVMCPPQLVPCQTLAPG